jgi:hypothetical protein
MYISIPATGKPIEQVGVLLPRQKKKGLVERKREKRDRAKA